MGRRGGLDEAWIKGKPPHQRKIARVVEPIERGLTKKAPTGGGLGRQLREDLARIAEDRLGARMAVLRIEDRVVAGLLDHLGKIELEHRIVLAKQHHEPDGVTSD